MEDVDDYHWPLEVVEVNSSEEVERLSITPNAEKNTRSKPLHCEYCDHGLESLNDELEQQMDHSSPSHSSIAKVSWSELYSMHTPPPHTATRSESGHSRNKPKFQQDSSQLNTNNKFKKTFCSFGHSVKRLKSNNHVLCYGTNIVPEFNPMLKHQTINSWINKVEECAEFYDWDELEIIHYALPKLTGSAKSWYQSLSSVSFTWDEWKSKLIDSFQCRQNYAELLMEMLALRVKRGESLVQYYYSKLNLLHRCEITGKRAVDCILHGIESREIYIGAVALQCNSPEEVLKYLQSVEKY